jgi:hypothetical protein
VGGKEGRSDEGEKWEIREEGIESDEEQKRTGWVCP